LKLLNLVLYFYILIPYCIRAAEINPVAFSNKVNSAAFEENLGQIKYLDNKPAPEVKYVFKQGNLKIFLLKTGLAYQLEKYEQDTNQLILLPQIYPDSYRDSGSFLQTYRMDMELVGANPHAEIIAEGKSQDYSNYYQPDLIQTHSYQKVIYKNIYPGIDWVIYSTPPSPNGRGKGGVKFDFIVHPGADPNLIRLKYKNAEQIYLDHYGNLILRNRLGDIRENAPIAFQENENIPLKFLLKDSIVAFDIKLFDRNQGLTIDPKLDWSTYYGGSGSENRTFGCKVDGHSNVYLIGETNSSNNISYNGYQMNYQTETGANSNAFVVKFNMQGQRLWASYYGMNYRTIDAIIDKKNNIILVGTTGYTTINFSSNGHQNYYGGGTSDGLIVKFDSTGTRLWASYYGGDGSEGISSCATDDSCSIYFAGGTNSSNNIAQNGYQDTLYPKYYTNGSLYMNNCLVKLNEYGIRQWGSYYGIGGSDAKLILHNANIYLLFISQADTSFLYSNNYSVSSSMLKFGLAKFNLNGNRIFGKPILTNRNPNSVSRNFQLNQHFLFLVESINDIGTASGFQPNNGGSSDLHVTKLDTIGNEVWTSYCGGNGPESGDYIAFDQHDNMYIAGRTQSNQGIYYRGLNSTLGGGTDVFVTKVSKSGNRIWSSYFGGNLNETQGHVSCDKYNNLYVAGVTLSTSGISLNGHQNNLNGYSDAFLMKISCNRYDTIRDTICRGDSLYYRNKYFTQAGLYTDSLLTWDICDSIITLHLTVLRRDTTYLYDTICAGTSYVWNGTYRTMSGIYRDTLTNNVGCDSFLVLNLHIKRTDTIHIYDTSCNNLPKTFNGQNLTLAGVYRDTFMNAVGCDSHIFYHFIPKPIYETPLSRAICANDSTLFGGKYYKLAGVYYDTLKTIRNCDSVLKLTLTINLLDTNRQTQSICRGKSYNFYSQILTNAGTYSHKWTNRNGCDSTILLTLSVIDSSTYSFNRMLCSGQSFPFNNQNLTQAGVYRDTFMNYLGCDSFVTLNLSFGLVLYDTLRQTVCAGQVFRGYSSPGTYYETYKSNQGCDSILTIYLKHLSPTEYKTIQHSKCGAFRYGSITYTQNDSFTETIKNYLNCDSIMTKHFVSITEPQPKFLADKTIEFCEEIMHRGQRKTNSFFTLDTIKSLEYPYCDSLYQPYYYRRESRPILSPITKQIDTVIKGETTNIQVSGAQNYQWSTGEQSPSIRPQITEDKTFEVTTWNLADCEEKMQFSIYVIDQPLINFPTAFSPNGDGLNDYFSPDLSGNISIDYFQVFNRWGEKVYEHSPLSKGWDGSYHSKPAANGLYTYTLRYSYLGRSFTRSGEVMMVR
jgi:gliding motility-associated-like protein